MKSLPYQPGQEENLAVKLYRKLNPRSRATCVTACRAKKRRMFKDCTFCRIELFDITGYKTNNSRFVEAQKNHSLACARAYLELHKDAAYLLQFDSKLTSKFIREIDETATGRTVKAPLL